MEDISEKGNAGFTDYLFGKINKENGCDFTATFNLIESQFQISWILELNLNF